MSFVFQGLEIDRISFGSQVENAFSMLWLSIDNALNLLCSSDQENYTALSKILALVQVLFGYVKGGSGSSFDWTSDLGSRFEKFCYSRRNILSLICSQNISRLSGSMNMLLYHPRKILDFETKKAFFEHKVRSETRSYSREMGTRLSVRRDCIFEDSFHQLMAMTSSELRYPITVKFFGEEGVDAGGLTREWFLVLSREIFNPDYLLFRSAANNQSVFQPNKFSYWNPDHLSYFEFVGKFVGKAIADGHLLDAFFTRSFYKHILGIPPSMTDMESLDPEYFKSLKWILDNPIDGCLDLTFSAEMDEFGVTKVVDLKPFDRNVKVTDNNKGEYVRLVTDLKMTQEILNQISAFLKGFRSLIPAELVSIFNDHELELLISGLPTIDVQDLRSNTEYRGLSEDSETVQWFWQVVFALDPKDLALLLQFVTGTSKVPLDGFKNLRGMNGNQRFQIQQAQGTDRLPVAHTCFNQLDLPHYSSKAVLEEKLLTAIRECSEGFQFA